MSLTNAPTIWETKMDHDFDIRLGQKLGSITEFLCSVQNSECMPLLWKISAGEAINQKSPFVNYFQLSYQLQTTQYHSCIPADYLTPMLSDLHLAKMFKMGGFNIQFIIFKLML